MVWPAILLTAGSLARQGARSASAIRHWLLWLSGACLLVAASKVAFYGWGIGVRAWNLTCFSGHTVLALGFWPMFGAILVSPQRPRLRLAMICLGLCLGILAGLSRALLGVHSLSEVLAGIALGGGVAGLSLRALRAIWLPLGRVLVASAVVLVLSAWGGSRLAPPLPTERWFRQVATALSGNEKPYSRHRWLAAEQMPGRH